MATSKSVKANTAKVTSRSIASKPTKKQISESIAELSAGVKVDDCIDFYVHEKGGNNALYGDFNSDTDHKAMYTTAAIISAGAAIMDGDTIKPAKGKARRLTGLLGKRASSYWVGEGWLESGTLTGAGLAQINSRLSGTHKGGGYKPTLDGIRDIVAAMTGGKPSTVKIGAKEYAFKKVLNI